MRKDIFAAALFTLAASGTAASAAIGALDGKASPAPAVASAAAAVRADAEQPVEANGRDSQKRAPTAAPSGADGVMAAAAEFVSAFNELDQQRFDALWAEDASVFFPRPPFPIRRIDGKTEVLAWFKRFMDAQRSGGDSPEVDPKDLRILMAGPGSAVVSFHLGNNPDSAGRRTLVYRREAAGWRIVHLHASGLTTEKR